MEDNAARKQGAGHGTDDPQMHMRRERGRPINHSAAEVDSRAPAKRALELTQAVKIMNSVKGTRYAHAVFNVCPSRVPDVDTKREECTAEGAEGGLRAESCLDSPTKGWTVKTSKR